MNKQTRRANLKKLQLREGKSTENCSEKKRNTRSSENTMIISEYFVPPVVPIVTSRMPENCLTRMQEEEESAKCNILLSPPTTSAKTAKDGKTKRAKLQDFMLRDDDFEASTQIRKAPKVKKTKSIDAKKFSQQRSKKQPNIKSAFLRNELMFADIAAQHCIADNFSPEDVEMALALSKSEIEVSRSSIAANVDDNHVVVEMLNSKGKPIENANESIRTKLRRYGFRTGDPKDYVDCTTNLLPGGYHSRKKCKWANKFTALTLRNPEIQFKRAKHKTEDFLAQCIKVTHSTDSEMYLQPYEILTDFLKPFMVSRNDMIVDQSGKFSMPTNTNLEIYFVDKLFDVTTVNAGHLLKDWNAIQGRDLSPQRQSKEVQIMEKKLKSVYHDLEAYFHLPPQTHTKSCVKDIAKSSNNDDNIHSKSEAKLNDTFEAIDSSNSCKVMQLKLATINSKEFVACIQETVIENEVDNCEHIKEVTDNNTTSTSNSPSLQIEQRTTSPDIFADSDVEMDRSTTTGTETINYTTENHLGIATYEIYSSDEAKMASRNGNMTINFNKPSANEPVVIDLTQTDGNSHSSEENLINGNVLNKSSEILYKNLLEDTVNMSFLDELNEQKIEAESIAAVIAENNEVIETLTAKYHGNVEFKDSKWKTRSLTQLNQSKCLKRSFSMTQRQQNYFGNDYSESEITIAQRSENSILQRRSKSALFPPSLNTTYDTNLKLSSLSIDLTQEDGMNDEVDYAADECVLSDDEINYSMWKETKRASLNDDNPHEFSVLDLIENEEPLVQTASSLSLDSISPRFTSNEQNFDNICHDFAMQKSESSVTETIFKTPTKETHCSDTSFNLSAKESNAPIRRFRSESSARKFNDLLLDFQRGDITPPRYDDFDEFDKLIYGSIKKKNLTTKGTSNTPQGIEKLLSADISFVPDHVSPTKLISSSTKSQTPTKNNKVDEITFEGRIYSVRACKSPIKDYSTYSDDKLLKILYDYGIKPLKRAQAVKLLQYIYDVTHPVIEEPPGVPSSVKTRTCSDDFDQLSKKYGISQPKTTILKNQQTTVGNEQVTSTCIEIKSKLNLNDCNGEMLLRYQSDLNATLLPHELYILPTNVTKKTARPLLPFHIAWHNLLCSNEALHENLLTFQPIDLQEIFLFLKSLGYRYDPKEMKTFFDNRCIIFRYDLTPPGKTANNRYARTTKSKVSAKN